MSEKVYGCNLCRPRKFFLGEEKFTEHMLMHGEQYLCDYICSCPATSVAERVERETIEAMMKAVEGLRQNSHIHHGSYVQGHNHAIDKIISAIRKAGGE